MRILTEANEKVKQQESQPCPISPVLSPECPSTRFQVDGALVIGPVAAAGQGRAAGAKQLTVYDIKQWGQHGSVTPDTQTDGRAAEDLRTGTSAAPSALGRAAGGRVGVNSPLPCSVVGRAVKAIEAAFQGRVVVDAPSLVRRDRVIQRAGLDQSYSSASTPKHCERAIYLRGSCDHGELRWIMKPCGTRSCSVCGPVRRARIADRIKLGIETLACNEGAGWFVGTFDWDIGKPAAVKVVGKFVRWVRKRLGRQVQYVSTWELTEKGRLHVNIVFAPWGYVGQNELAAAWRKAGGGRVVWIKRVGAGVSAEVVKVFFLARYLAKKDQAVTEGRGVCYSRGWPKLLAPERAERKGRVHWAWFREDDWQVGEFEWDKGRYIWREVNPGEWALYWGEHCDCFQFEGTGPPLARAGPGAVLGVLADVEH